MTTFQSHPLPIFVLIYPQSLGYGKTRLRRDCTIIIDITQVLLFAEVLINTNKTVILTGISKQDLKNTSQFNSLGYFVK